LKKVNQLYFKMIHNRKMSQINQLVNLIYYVILHKGINLLIIIILTKRVIKFIIIKKILQSLFNIIKQSLKHFKI
jgi:hypothetical protein